MSVLRRASLSYFLRHPWQLSLALTGIIAGVAVMAAVDIATASAGRAFELSMEAIYGEATQQIVAGPAGVDERLYVRLRTSEGVRNIAPVVEGYVDVGATTLRLLGVDILAERGFRDWLRPEKAGGVGATDPTDGDRELVRRLLAEPGAAVLSRATAARLGLTTGKSFEVLADGSTSRATVVGLVGAADDARLDNLLLVDIATAQDWLRMVGRLSRIDLRPGTQETGGVQRVRRLLPAGVQVLEAAGRTEALRAMSEAFMTNLRAMSLLALLVGVFLIYNSVSFAVLQRRGTLGVLRALGLTRRDTFMLVMREAMVLAVLGTLTGLVAGTWLGERLLSLVARSVNDLYFVVSVTGVSLTLAGVLKGFAAGLCATLLAAAIPALEAARSRPRLALARSDLERRSRSLLPIVAGAGAGMVGLAIVLLAGPGRDLVTGLTAVFLVLFGCALVLPLLVRMLTKPVAAVAGAWGGVTARQAIGGVDASLSRTGVAVVALAVAVSATVGVTVMVDSFRAAVGAWVERSLRADIYVGVGRGTLQPALVRDIVGLAGVAAHSTSRRVWLEREGTRTRVIVLDLPAAAYDGTRLLAGDPAEAWPAFEDAGSLLVSASYAYRHALSRGDTVTLPSDHGARAFPVAGIYQSYDADLDTVLMSRRTYDASWNDPAIDSIGLYLEAGADPERVTAAVRQASRGRQSLVVRSNRDLRAVSLAIFDRTFVITDVLYWLAVGVALVGILGAMLALQLERAREYAILRALGMTPAQLGRLIAGQASYLGILAGLAAVPLGLAMAWLLIEVINRRAFGWQMAMSVSFGSLLSAVLYSATAALLAGVYPAWRAARRLPASAMREE